MEDQMAVLLKHMVGLINELARETRAEAADLDAAHAKTAAKFGKRMAPMPTALWDQANALQDYATQLEALLPSKEGD